LTSLIYKYCPPNRFTLDNLRSRTIFCRHPGQFNDPFEFWATVQEGVPDFREDEARFRAAVAAWGFPGDIIDNLPLDRDTLKDYFDGLADGAPSMNLIYDRARVSCFSSDAANLLMWSHYSDGMRGCCLGFDSCLVATETESCFFADVQYMKSPPVIDTLVYAVVEDLFNYAIEHGYEEYDGESLRKQLNELMALALSSKPEEWRYEKERRLIIHTKPADTGSCLHRYTAPALQRVIIGEKMDPGYRLELMAVISQLDAPVVVQEAVRSDATYSLTIRDLVL
jgi:hypothetical protein